MIEPAKTINEYFAKPPLAHTAYGFWVGLKLDRYGNRGFSIVAKDKTHDDDENAVTMQYGVITFDETYTKGTIYSDDVDMRVQTRNPTLAIEIMERMY